MNDDGRSAVEVKPETQADNGSEGRRQDDEAGPLSFTTSSKLRSC